MPKSSTYHLTLHLPDILAGLPASKLIWMDGWICCVLPFERLEMGSLLNRDFFKRFTCSLTTTDYSPIISRTSQCRRIDLRVWSHASEPGLLRRYDAGVSACSQ